MGQEFFEITSEKLIIEDYSKILESQEQGAVLWFLGNVRNRNEGQSVRAVTYEGVKALGEETFRLIAQECREKWGESLNIVAVHRLGALMAGECSIVIGVASPHRVAAYEASRYFIEEVKLRLPIWKKEHYCDGNETWLKGNSLNG